MFQRWITYGWWGVVVVHTKHINKSTTIHLELTLFVYRRIKKNTKTEIWINKHLWRRNKKKMKKIPQILTFCFLVEDVYSNRYKLEPNHKISKNFWQTEENKRKKEKIEWKGLIIYGIHVRARHTFLHNTQNVLAVGLSYPSSIFSYILCLFFVSKSSVFWFCVFFLQFISLFQFMLLVKIFVSTKFQPPK